MNRKYDKKEFYRAHLARDPRFDGKFFVAVKTTKIYCRPVCPARKAKLENLDFYIYAAEAEAAGYRPCLRCRPETAPGSPAWLGTMNTVQRAIRLMEQPGMDNPSISNIAEHLGVGERWLRELFGQQVGVSPQALLLVKKLDVAKNLLENSNVSITDIAFSSGFQSIRRFNDAFKTRFKTTPSAFRKTMESSESQCLQLRFRPPYDWNSMLQFLSARSLPSMEHVAGNSYQRVINYQGQIGWLKVSLGEENRLIVEFKFPKPANIINFIRRVKDMFDLDADPLAIERDLNRDKKLKPLMKEHKGLRVPGCWDSFELAVRAIIGQRISVKAARAALIKLVDLYGDKFSDKNLSVTHCFPTPETIIKQDLAAVGITKTKISSIKALAHAIITKQLVLDGIKNYEETYEQLIAIKGIGDWTAQYIAMRALKNPDAFPESDLELQKKIKHYQLTSEKWSPWRAYAAILLFTITSEQSSAKN